MHIADAGLGKPGKKNNNIQERFNSTQRGVLQRQARHQEEGLAPVRGLGVWYNFVRPHDSPECTPAEAAGITIRGSNKRGTPVGNACLAAWGGGEGTEPPDRAPAVPPGFLSGPGAPAVRLHWKRLCRRGTTAAGMGNEVTNY